MVFDAAAGLHDLVRAHGRIAHEDQLVVAVVLADDVPGGELLREAAPVVLPHVVVDAVVEVVELQVLELALDRGEQLLDALDVLVHGATHVHEQQHLHVVVALGHHLDVEVPGVGGRAADGVRQVQFQVVALACEAAQPPQGHLDVARAELLGIVVVAVGALLPHLHGTFVLASAADAHALRVVPAVAVGAGAAGADPLASALVALLLLFQALLQRLHELVPAHLLDGGFLLGREFALQDLAQPVGGHLLAEVGHHLDALEVGAERAVELVEVLLVLDQDGAREVVEVVDAPAVFGLRADDARLQRLQQGEVFLDRHRQLAGAQRVEEVDQHGARPSRVTPRPRRPARRRDAAPAGTAGGPGFRAIRPRAGCTSPCRGWCRRAAARGHGARRPFSRPAARWRAARRS